MIKRKNKEVNYLNTSIRGMENEIKNNSSQTSAPIHLNSRVKQILYEACNNYILNRLHNINHHIAMLEESLQSETKSSAGDKHETGRASIQLEREKAGVQLMEAEKIQQQLQRISTENTPATVQLGSVIITNKYHYFIAIPAGKITADGMNFFAIGNDAPIAKMMLGKSVNDTITFNKQQFTITAIF
ncbi:3-oxoacyl-ACP synthase [Zhouia sp. PK063]|uniref:3-oxoacyl-ACP synthase n=1 Tax=Zhouia sp. PK063 TaxID=3373602 RepID=UPI00378D3D39